MINPKDTISLNLDCTHILWFKIRLYRENTHDEKTLGYYVHFFSRIERINLLDRNLKINSVRSSSQVNDCSLQCSRYLWRVVSLNLTWSLSEKSITCHISTEKLNRFFFFSIRGVLVFVFSIKRARASRVMKWANSGERKDNSLTFNAENGK